MADHVELIRKYGGSAPRYTSYPTAPHFNESVNETVYRGWLANSGESNPISVYIHIPYCHQLCWYCGCNTRATQSYEPVAQYLETLLKEVALIRRTMPNRLSIQRLHWGGGTPTILSGGDFLAATNAIRESFDFADDAEIAVEIDPRSLTESKVELLASAGVSRASLGVQEFAEHVQSAINRRQSHRKVVQSVAMLRSAGVRSINFDLMYGLPRQTVEDVKTTAVLSAELRPDRVSVFGYAHVPWMKPHQRLIDEGSLPDGEERSRQASAAAHILTQAGYVPIGLDHYALPDDSLALLAKARGLRRNFQGYTDDQTDTLIGLGASAIGSLPQGYVQNITDTRRYMGAVNTGRLPIARGIEISKEDKLRRAIIERLMCDYSADLKIICKQHNAEPDIFKYERGELEALEKDGIVSLDGDTINIEPEFRPYVRTVCAVFDSYFKTSKARHSRVV